MSTIAVVIPLYNKIKHVERSLRSVFQQRRAFDEIVIVDDRSTDGSLEFVRELVRVNSGFPVKIIQHEVNGGPGAARNTGLAATNSDFICFLDADDFLDPEFLFQVEEDGPFPEGMGVIVYQVREQSMGIIRPSLARLEKYLRQVSPKRFSVNKWAEAMVYEPIFCSGSNAIVAGALARQTQFNEDVRNFEDWDFYFRICDFATKAGSGIYVCSVVGLTYSDDDVHSLSRARALSKHLMKLPPLVRDSGLPTEVRKFTAGVWLCHVAQRCTFFQGVRMILRTGTEPFAMRPSFRHLAYACAGLVLGTGGWQIVSRLRKRLFYD